MLTSAAYLLVWPWPLVTNSRFSFLQHCFYDIQTMRMGVGELHFLFNHTVLIIYRSAEPVFCLALNYVPTPLGIGGWWILGDIREHLCFSILPCKAEYPLIRLRLRCVNVWESNRFNTDQVYDNLLCVSVRGSVAFALLSQPIPAVLKPVYGVS